MNDFGLLISRHFTALPSLADTQPHELLLDDRGRLIIAGRFLEDSPHIDTDPGIFMLAVANHTESALHDTDGDYAALQVDSSGRLRVVADIDTSALAEKNEDDPHGNGDIGNYILAVRQDTRPTDANTSADGDYASLFVNNNGELYVHDLDSNATLSNIDTSLNNIETDISDFKQQEDELHVSGDYGFMPLAVQKDADGALAGDGDYAPFQVNENGFLKVTQPSSAQLGTESYTVTDALAAGGDGLETITAAATPWVTVASLAVAASTTAYVYGYQWACDQNAQVRLVTDDTVNTVYYKTDINSSAEPGDSEHWGEGGRIEIPGAANLEIRLQIKKRATPGGNANGTGSIHVRVE